MALNRPFRKTIASWIIAVTCAIATIALVQYRLLCEIEEKANSVASSHSHSVSHNADSHSHGHEHVHDDEHNHQDEKSDDGCCEKASSTEIVSASSQLRFLKYFSIPIIEAHAFAETKALLEFVAAQSEPLGEQRHIPPPISIHIPSTILRI